MRRLRMIWQIYSDKLVRCKQLIQSQIRRKNMAKLRKLMKQRRSRKRKLACVWLYDIEKMDSLKKELEQLGKQIAKLEEKIS